MDGDNLHDRAAEAANRIWPLAGCPQLPSDPEQSGQWVAARDGYLQGWRHAHEDLWAHRDRREEWQDEPRPGIASEAGYQAGYEDAMSSLSRSVAAEGG